MIKVGKIINCRNCGEPQKCNIPIEIDDYYGFKAKDHACGPCWTPKILEIKDHKERNEWKKTIKKLINKIKKSE